MHYPSIRIAGSILSADLIDLIESGNKHSQDAKAFGFDAKTQVKDEIADAWANARAYWSIFQNKLSKLDESATAVTETRNLAFIRNLYADILEDENYPTDFESSHNGEVLCFNNQGELVERISVSTDISPLPFLGTPQADN